MHGHATGPCPDTTPCRPSPTDALSSSEVLHSGANVHHLLLVVICHPRLSSLLLFPQLSATLLCLYYDGMATAGPEFMAGEMLGILVSQKFLLAAVYPKVPVARRPSVGDWAALVVPASVLVLIVNTLLAQWCESHGSPTGHRI